MRTCPHGVEDGGEAAVLDDLDPLVGALRERGFAVVGPVARDGVIRFAELGSAADLPRGLADEQAPGFYRLHERGELVFGFAASPDAVKRYTHPPRSVLFRMRGGVPEKVPPRAGKVALLGVRACDLAALAVQDRVFLGGRHPDEAYRERREALFLIAVTCAAPGGTCFCASMGTGPRPTSGFDVALTELTGPHRFLAEAGSERGAELLAALPSRPAGDADRAAAREVGAAAARMGRRVDLDGVRERLIERRESPLWDEIASRCLTCAACTMVCPTCFCVTVEDGVDLADGTAERAERWDSCFTLGFSELGGAPLRSSGAARYRQWLSHKFSTWVDQFGTYGCVGCGRCVTWCPAGIDITEELERLR
ncbi:Anaerobic sulfite reductase subunit A [Nonomuraea coxensis DSM 45129]|uniref:Anaerobic sulfite reductase subunit A n=1 Tax=Nonomuraea coxensis DSM 45129 TaxID=1122611 RepID=A0ABX8U3Z4_9ACTN|nr:4Fe-4S dicluster domain-containing protein [Nonomuraea coxensis]QYC41844.1 Anaerobic sulfite reductase subunit A [Nonomuraea coxensis DSM 45129]